MIDGLFFQKYSAHALLLGIDEYIFMYIYIIYLENALRTWQLTKNVLSMDINN
jgi:hypothetical protein